MLRGAALTAVTFLALLTAAGCGGSGRSTAAFCSTLQQGLANAHAGAQQIATETGKNALVGLVDAFGSIGDYERFLDKLNGVAPSEIQSDMNTIDTDFHSSLDDTGSAAVGLLVGDPAGLAKIVFRQLIHVNSYRRVNDFASQNCGSQIVPT
jgi:hypothetical protein